MDAIVIEKSRDYSLLDMHTGEILEYRKARKVSVDEFMMVYLSSYSEVLKLTGMQMKVLWCCWRYSTFNDKNCSMGNIVHNDSFFKENCKKDGLNTSDAVINNAFSYLVKQGFLIKKCKGTYLLNPKYFFKGTVSDRSKIQYNLFVEPKEKELEESLARFNAQYADESKTKRAVD